MRAAGPLLYFAHVAGANDQERNETVDALRGIASLAVCWYHLTNGDRKFLPAGFVTASGSHGDLGVEVFFVISGFVIPYALHRAAYGLRNYPRFVLKRIVRLDPPYLATIAFILTYRYFIWGQQFHFSARQTLLHLGYVNVFFGYPWFNVVFWSLAIEFQYYLLIGLAFPLLVSHRATIRILTYASCGTAFLAPSGAFVFHYLFLFLLGILVFQRKIGLLTRAPFLVLLGTAAAGVWLTMGFLPALVGLASALAIATLEIKGRLLLFLGSISYSLYLLHEPIGGSLISASLRRVQGVGGRFAVLGAAFGASIGAAYLLWRFVERPSQRLASGLKYS